MVFGNRIEIIISARDMFSRTFTKASLSMKSFKKAAVGVIAVGAAVAFALGKSVSTAIEFESAFTGVKKTVELSEKEFKELEERFKTLSTQTGTTFVELSKIGEIAGQLGVEGVDNLAKFTSVIADIAVTTNLTSEAAAVSFARIANVMGEPIENVDRMGSAIVDLGNNFATSEQEIVNMTMRIMGAGRTIGLNTQQVFGMSAALSALGIRAEMGGSAISRAMITISEAVSGGSITIEEFAKTTDKTGDELTAEFSKMSSTLTDYAKVAGMTTEEFSKAWKEKPVEALSKVIIGLKRMTDEGENVFGMLDDLDLKSIRIKDTMLRLASSTDGITGAVNKSSEAWEENTALTEEAQKRYATMERELAKVKAEFAILGNEIGNMLIPIIKDMLPVVKSVINFFKELPEPVKQAVIVLGLVTIAMAILTAVILAVTLVSSPWLLIIGAIILAITGLILLILNWQKVIDFLSRIFVKAAGVMDKGWELFKDGFIIALEVMKNTAIIVWNAIIDFIGNKIQKAIDFFNILIAGANQIKGINLNFIPDIDLSGFKGQITDIGALRARLSIERTERAGRFEAFGERFKTQVVINIENVNGLDPEEISRALSNELGEKTTL